MKRELLAFALLVGLFVGFPSSLLTYQALRTHEPGVHVIAVDASAPADGGWQPDTIRVTVGERVRLRIASRDVTHGFAIPALGVKVDEILPGHVEEVEFTAAQVGRYPFACTRWCSVDHWRMRGVLEIVDSSGRMAAVQARGAPLYQQLKLDIDAMHPARNVPAEMPSAARGDTASAHIPDDINNPNALLIQSPSELFARLRTDPALASQSDMELWDALAATWLRAAGTDAVLRGQSLYAQDCAACHGEQGQGDGTAGLKLPGRAAMDPTMPRGPVDFTNVTEMLGASDAVLQGKVLRGGMGTGMPEWRSIYTDQDISDVVSYIRSFTFNNDLNR